MRNFYSLPRRRQWLWAGVLACGMLVPGMVVGAVATAVALLAGRGGDADFLPLLLVPFGLMLMVPLMAVAAQFFTAPVLYLIGHLRYYSPLLLVEGPTPALYRIHGGTSFDYFVHLRWADRGAPARRKTMRWYLQGLLAIADEVEAGKVPGSVRIVGTSYVFGERTARRLGFTVEPPDPAMRGGLMLNYLNLFWKYSFARGRLAFPNLKRIRQAATTGDELLRHRPRIQALLDRIARDRDGAPAAAA